MKKTKIITAAIVVLAITVLAGQAVGQPGGRGRGGQGWGGGPGWGPGITGRPQINANNDPVQPDDSWVPGPYYPWGQGPNQNFQPQQGRGPRGFGRNFQGPRGPYCPYGQGPNQNIPGRQGRDSGRLNRDFQGKGPGGFGQGFQGRGQGPRGRGFGRRDMMIQRGPGAGRGGRGGRNAGPGMSGRGLRGFARRNTLPQGWGMNGRRGQLGPGGIGRPSRGIQPRWFAPQDRDQTNQPSPPRGRGWTPRAGQGRDWRQGMRPGWRQNTQPETAPDANAPKPPIVEDQPEIPQGQ